MNRKIKAIVVGLGNIGLRYDLESPGHTIMTHTRACQEHSHVQLIGGVELNEKTRAFFEGATSLPAFTSVADAIEAQGRPELIIISTPSVVRSDIVHQCLNFKPKAILLEKPLAMSVAEGARIERICRTKGVLLAVNYFRRFDPALTIMCRDIQQGRFGALKYASCIYTGDLLNAGSHYVDLFNWWFGLPRGLLDVTPFGQKLAFTLDYHGAPVTFRTMDTVYGLGELDLFFEKKRIVFKDYCEAFHVFESQRDPLFPAYQRLTTSKHKFRQPDFLRYQYHVLDVLVAALTRKGTIPSTGKTAFSALKICMDVMNEQSSANRVK